MKNSQKTPKKGNILETTLSNVFSLLDDSPGQPLKPSDKTASRLEQNILFTIKRHQASIDWLIDTHSHGKVRPRTRKVLWWAIAELVYLDGAAAHAVVDSATHFVKTRHAPQEASFVNALLRRISDAVVTTQDLLADAPEHVRLEMPSCLWKRWQDSMGANRAREIAQTILTPAPLVFRQSTWPAVDSATPEELEPIDSPEWLPNARLYRPRLPHLDIGKFMAEHPQMYIQDPATLLAPSLLAPVPGETIADLCAAPGGKSRLIAELLHDTGRLFCRDRAEDKIPRLKANLKAFSCADIRQGDAAQPDLPPHCLDAVLLDVPCTNTGVLRRKPDAKWSFDNKKLAELISAQQTILEAALSLLKTGGRLVYSTCSLEPEENTRQIRGFLDRHPEAHLVKEQLLYPTDTHDGAYAALVSLKRQ